MMKEVHTRLFEWGQTGLLILLIVLLLCVASELNVYLVGSTFILLVGYHLWSTHRLRSVTFLPTGLLVLHLGIYLILCSLIIWASTTPEEESIFWVVFLLPIVAAATRLALSGTVAVAAVSALIYALLLPPRMYLPQEGWEELPEFATLGIAFFFVGTLVHSLSREMRLQLEVEKNLNRSLLEHQVALKQSLEKLAAAEELVRRKDRLAALGEMAAGVAHEIRNPLGIVSSSAQLLSRRLAGNPGVSQELIAVILKETDRLNALISDFLAFGGEVRVDLSPAPLAPLVTEAVEAFRGVSAGKSVRFVLEGKPAPLTARIDQALLKQVLLNLFLNALEASAAGDTVIVALRGDGDVARILVRDSGSGIPEEIKGKVFNPFFTTREGGTGLGLANAHKYVELMGGTLEFESQPGQGTTFAIVLPLEN